jgi:SPP1 family predicted phage head-tail adaptor
MNRAAADFDRRIMIQVVTETPDGAGDVVQTWADAFPLWAKRSDSRGREFFGAQQTIRDADTAWTVRQSTETRAIAPETNRVVYAGRVFEIISIAEGKERGDVFEILTASRPDGRGARGTGGVSA